jgi:DNA-binding winged helix-turn-helix (wHTH) protein
MATRYRFDGFTLSPARRLLARDGRPVPLIPRYFDLLVLLVERRGEALHRRELMDRVWADVVVSEGALTQAVRTLRRTLEADGGGAEFIRTVSRHGYQFAHPVVEEADADETAPVPDPEPPPPVAGVDERRAAALARLLDAATDDDGRREAAGELHALGTAAALAGLGADAAGARAWAYLRDTRWEQAEAGPVPVFGAPGPVRAWAALGALRLRRAVRFVGERWAAASAGGAAAGALAGVVGGGVLALLRETPLDASLLLTLLLVGVVIGGLGAAGVGCGLAAAEAAVRSWRTLALVIGGALGGAVVGAAARDLARGLLVTVSGEDVAAIGGGVEGLVIGAAAGLAWGWGTRGAEGGLAAPHGWRRARLALVTGLACAGAATALTLAGGALGATSLHRLAERFPDSRVRLDAMGRLAGEPGFGPRTRAGLGAWEGLLFGGGLAWGLARRPRQRSLSEP